MQNMKILKYPKQRSKVFLFQNSEQNETELQTSQPLQKFCNIFLIIISFVVSYQWRIEDKVWKEGQNDNLLVW